MVQKLPQTVTPPTDRALHTARPQHNNPASLHNHNQPRASTKAYSASVTVDDESAIAHSRTPSLTYPPHHTPPNQLSAAPPRAAACPLRQNMLPTLLRITPRDADAEDPEDLFATALGTIFTDDLRNQHGDPGALIAYLSRRLDAGLDLSVADPAGEEERKKFAHYLWNAGVLMAELCGGRPRWGVGGGGEDGMDRVLDGLEWRLAGDREWWVGEEEEGRWSVEGQRVLELGAGG